jgi:dihydrofolate reductase
MIISAVVAIDKNNVIGKDNDIPWYLPADLQYFKKITLGHHILMGRKCFESIGRPLPKRTNIIVTRNPFFIATGTVVVHSIKEGISLAKKNKEEELFIIGGGDIYRHSLDIWDKLYLTVVDTEVDGDVFFPNINFDEWKLISSESHEKDEKNEFNYRFEIWEKLRK